MFPKVKKIKKSIYLDFAATTPVDVKVVKAMEPFWGRLFGNPSSLYGQGREAKKAVDEARKMIADIIGAKSSEIIFTAGGTESCNLAIFGAARMNTNFKTDKHGSPHLITSAIEHHCVLNSFKALAGEGYRTSLIGVDVNGFIKINELKAAVKPETILISVMLANNEIGTIEPIIEIGKWLKGKNQERRQKHQPQIIFHTDACQAAGLLDLNVNRLGVDLMSVNGSKIYGPKQTGFLFVKDGVNLKPLIYGGGQERNLRSGTENVPGIVGLAKALELATKDKKLRNFEIGKLQKYFIQKLIKIGGVELNGPGPRVTLGQKESSDRGLPSVRLLNNINITIKGVEGEALMLYLDSYGIAVSTGSACSTGSSDASHVLLAIRRSEKDAKSSIRFSLGKTTTKADLDYVLKVLPDIVVEMRKMKPVV
jgi:cysteine desulfurase